MTARVRLSCPLAGVALALSALACGNGNDGYDESWRVLPPVALGTAVAYVESTSATAYLIDPAATPLEAKLAPLGKRPVRAVRRLGHDELLVLSQGERGGPGVPPEAPSLRVIAAGGAQGRSITLGSRFNALTQSPDGRFVVLFFSPDDKNTGTSDLLFNPNEIAVVDLMSAMPIAAARTLRSFGGVPLGVVFSPRLTLPFAGGRALHLAVALSDGYVTLFDLEDAQKAEITVPLTLPGDPRRVRPVQVLFEQRDPAREPTLFVRAEASNDVYALRLAAATERPDGSQGVANDFRPVLSQLGAGSGPADMALFDAEDGPRLLVVSPGSGEALVLDARTSRTTSLRLEAPASRILMFEASAPAEAKVRPRALLLQPGGAAQVAFLDLDRIEESGKRNLDTRPMGASVGEVVPFIDRGLVMVQHPTSGVGAQVSVIDLARRTISPLSGASTGAGRTVVGGPGADRLWIVPGAASVAPRLGFLSLPQLTPGEVRLDAVARHVLPLDPGKDGRRRLVVDHQGPAGHLTVLDADKPERQTARALVGFLYTDLLERKVP